MSKIAAIIQARISSTRLPGKILKRLPYKSGTSVLEQVIRRVKASKLASEVMVATTKDREDDRIIRLAEKEKVMWSRGENADVLSRYYFAAKENKIDVIVRITSDCPCIDPEIVDKVIEKNIETRSDYTSNASRRTFPVGLDVEVISFSALEKAYKNSKEPFEREHVAPYVYKSHPEGFKISSVEAKGKLRRPDIRITLDTEEDYALLCSIYDSLYPKDRMFHVEDIIDLINEKPWLLSINKKITHKRIFDSVHEEVMEALKVLDLQDLKRAKRFMEEKYDETFNNNRSRK